MKFLHRILLQGFVMALLYQVTALKGWAQSQTTISLEDLGYERTVLLEGSSPEFSVGIPAPLGGLMDSENSFVRLRLEPSPALDASSSVRFLINNEIIRLATVEELRQNPVVNLPLTSLPPAESFLTLSVQPRLNISTNYCQDIATGNLFLLLSQDSFFQITPQLADPTIEGFFSLPAERVVLSVPQSMDTEQTQAALWLYSLLSYQFRDRRTLVLWQQGAATAAAVAANESSLAQVTLHNDVNRPDIERTGNVLRVRNRPGVVQALAVQLDQPALVSQAVQIEDTAQLPAQSTLKRRSFQELGFETLTRRGAGTHTFPITFDLAQLGGRPRGNLALVLKSVFTPVDREAGDRLTAQIFFNNVLLKTYNLSDRSQLDETLFLPGTELRRTNTLDLQFVYEPGEGNCVVGPRDLTIQVQGDSYLSWNDYQPPTGDLEDFPHVFLAPGQVILDLEQPALIASTAYLLGTMSRLGREPVLPEVVAATTLSNRSQLPARSNGKRPTWRLLALPPEPVTFPAPIRLGQQFQILNPRNQDALLKAEPTTPIGLLQYFSAQGVPTLWLSWWGTQPQVVEKLSRSLADPRTQWANQLQGNVVTGVSFWDDYTQVQTWDLSGQTLRVDYPDATNWRLLLWRYRSLFVVLVAILAGVAAWTLYRRLGRTLTAPETETEVSSDSDSES